MTFCLSVRVKQEFWEGLDYFVSIHKSHQTYWGVLAFTVNAVYTNYFDSDTIFADITFQFATMQL